MINEMTHDYPSIGLPNVVFGVKKGDQLQPTVVHPFMDGLIVKLAKARPKWKLVGEQRAVRSDGPWWAHKFRVFEGNEELGVIDRGWQGGNDVFEFDNARLAAGRQRGYISRTKDMSKAFKAIIKSFGTKTVDERMASAIAMARERTSNIFGRKRSLFLTNSNELAGSTRLFLRKNYEAFAAFAKANGAPGIAVDNFPEVHQAYVDTLHIADVSQAGQGSVVLLNGSEYVVRTADGNKAILTSDELTPHMKRCIGMLKLVNVEQHVANVGVRVADDVMFIMPEGYGDGK